MICIYNHVIVPVPRMNESDHEARRLMRFKWYLVCLFDVAARAGPHVLKKLSFCGYAA